MWGDMSLDKDNAAVAYDAANKVNKKIVKSLIFFIV